MKKERHFLPDFVYGSIDGLVTTFAIISGVMGASLSAGIVLVLGFANVFADGFSMGISNYLSVKSENQLNDRDKISGFENPVRSGLVTFASFVLVGMIPLIPFVFGLFIQSGNSSLFTYSIVITAISFFLVGWFRGTITETNRFLASLETLFIGAAAAGISFGVGYLLQGLV